jgi:hypothetical protein
MARRTVSSIDALVQDAMQDVVARASVSIARAVAELAATRLADALETRVPAATRRPARRNVARADLTRWAADRRARRVPNFVIDLTGLKTKRQVVQKYGDGAVFEKGKPAPRAR